VHETRPPGAESPVLNPSHVSGPPAIYFPFLRGRDSLCRFPPVGWSQCRAVPSGSYVLPLLCSATHGGGCVGLAAVPEPDQETTGPYGRPNPPFAQAEEENKFSISKNLVSRGKNNPNGVAGGLSDRDRSSLVGRVVLRSAPLNVSNRNETCGAPFGRWFLSSGTATTTTKSFSPWRRGGIRSGLRCELNYLPAASLGKERNDVTNRGLEAEELSLSLFTVRYLFNQGWRLGPPYLS
jgi:hypothetical protein